MNFLKLARHLFTPLSCRAVNRFIIDYLEDRLSPAQRRRFERHISNCPQCNTYLDQYRTTIDLVRDQEPLDPPEALVEHTLTFLRGHMKPS